MKSVKITLLAALLISTAAPVQAGILSTAKNVAGKIGSSVFGTEAGRLVLLTTTVGVIFNSMLAQSKKRQLGRDKYYVVKRGSDYEGINICDLVAVTNTRLERFAIVDEQISDLENTVLRGKEAKPFLNKDQQATLKKLQIAYNKAREPQRSKPEKIEARINLATFVNGLVPNSFGSALRGGVIGCWAGCVYLLTKVIGSTLRSKFDRIASNTN